MEVSAAPLVRARKNFIEVALPLDAIDRASAREKSNRHGHSSTLHLRFAPAAREPIETVRNYVTIDWTLRKNVRANPHRHVKHVLRKHGYTPDSRSRLPGPCWSRPTFSPSAWQRDRIQQWQERDNLLHACV